MNLVRLVSEPDLAGIGIVECSPPSDWAEMTCLIEPCFVPQHGSLNRVVAVYSVVLRTSRSLKVWRWCA
ncbi:hypothetical protein [Nonomuraea wenchangensis]|uniref:hypothetical protein n=1 Tax=Nonomuraea wenchangensis TaxID=568860 RepID=UPI00379CB3CF